MMRAFAAGVSLAGWTLLALLFLPVSAAASDLGVTAAVVDTQSPIHIGDVVTIAIDIAGEGGSAARVPASFDLGGAELVGTPERMPITTADGRSGTRFLLRVQVFGTGEIAIPPIGFVSAANDQPIGARSPDVRFRVEPLTGPGESAKPVKLVMPPITSPPLVPVVIASLLASVVVYRSAMKIAGRPAPGEIALLQALIGRRRLYQPPEDIEPELVLAPAESAKHAVASLVERARARYDSVAMHEELSAVVAEYVARSLDLAPRERTTSEVLLAVRRKCGEDRAQALSRILRSCDLVKFAQAIPGEFEFFALAESVEQYVGEDVPVDEPGAVM